MTHSRPSQGFTLVELLIYISITSIALLTLTGFMVDISKSAIRARVAKEVQQNARLVLSRVTEVVRTANTIDAVNSVFDPSPPGSCTATSGKLVVQYSTPPSAATFDWLADAVRYNDGTGPIALTNNAVKVTQWCFHQVGGAINVEIEVTPAAGTFTAQRQHFTTTVVPRPSLY